MKVAITTMKKISSLLRPLAKSTFALAAAFSLITAAQAATGPAEKTELKFGFIKLTDMADLAVAYENGYFDDEGLTVELEAQANWKVVLDRVISGELDGSHMLLAQPVAANIGYGTPGRIGISFYHDAKHLCDYCFQRNLEKNEKKYPCGCRWEISSSNQRQHIKACC